MVVREGGQREGCGGRLLAGQDEVAWHGRQLRRSRPLHLTARNSRPRAPSSNIGDTAFKSAQLSVLMLVRLQRSYSFHAPGTCLPLTAAAVHLACLRTNRSWPSLTAIRKKHSGAAVDLWTVDSFERAMQLLQSSSGGQAALLACFLPPSWHHCSSHLAQSIASGCISVTALERPILLLAAALLSLLLWLEWTSVATTGLFTRSPCNCSNYNCKLTLERVTNTVAE
jgi:hypothetical protein